MRGNAIVNQTNSGMSRMSDPAEIQTLLVRIAEALERMAPPKQGVLDMGVGDAFVYDSNADNLRVIDKVSRIPLELLCGIDRVSEILLANTERFARGLPANNALLWGARGMGKSSLVKAVHATVNDAVDDPLALIEIHREDIDHLPDLLERLGRSGRRSLLFCDDLSFDAGETSYKSLKAVLEGGIEGRPDNVLFYATSNRRHLMPRQMIENERSTAINPGEAVEEKVSLSDRFGLWLGFHACNQETYLAMVHRYAGHFDLAVDDKDALEWAATRGNRSGRVAWQFIQDAAGRLGRVL